MLLGFLVIMALLLALSYVDQHYSGIVARKDCEIRSLHDQLARQRVITDEIEDEEWDLDMPDARADRPDPFTIRYPLDDAPWPTKDGVDQ